MSQPNCLCRPQEKGVALLLVVGIITLLSVIILNLSYKTILFQEQSVLIERKSRAEYLLKSALQFGRVLLFLPGPPTAPNQKPWRAFMKGDPIPAQMLQIPYPNVKISLEINPESRKLAVEGLQTNSATDYRDMFVLLFDNLGFSKDQDPWEDRSGRSRVLDSRQMVAALVDYVDADRNPYRLDSFSGVETHSDGTPFPDQLPLQLEELSQVPGFTPRRLSLLTPHMTVTPGLSGVNPNYASEEVLQAIDPSLTSSQYRALHDAARGPDGPLDGTSIQGYFPNYNQLNQYLSLSDTKFQIIAKVEVEGNSFFLRGLVESSTGSATAPTVENFRIY